MLINLTRISNKLSFLKIKISRRLKTHHIKFLQSNTWSKTKIITIISASKWFIETNSDYLAFHLITIYLSPFPTIALYKYNEQCRCIFADELYSQCEWISLQNILTGINHREICASLLLLLRINGVAIFLLRKLSRSRTFSWRMRPSAFCMRCKTVGEMAAKEKENKYFKLRVYSSARCIVFSAVKRPLYAPGSALPSCFLVFKCAHLPQGVESIVLLA